MENKKIIYFLLILLVVLMGVIYIILKKDTKKEPVQESIKKQVQEVSRKEESKFPLNIKGTVVSMTKDKFNLEFNGKIYEIGFKMETPIYKMKGVEKVKAAVYDIIAGTKLEATLNQETGDVMEAVIVQ